MGLEGAACTMAGTTSGIIMGSPQEGGVLWGAGPELLEWDLYSGGLLSSFNLWKGQENLGARG